MAIVSSHTLNSIDGTHAAGIATTLTRVTPDGTRSVLFETITDEGGRLMQEIDPAEIVSGATYEFMLATAAYFADYDLPRRGMQILQNVVVHFEMPDPAARYHMPLMLAPNSYSVWASSGPNG